MTVKATRQRLSVSIVIPAYNEERHLAACLEAIARQSVPPDEVIVVDNNSTDGTVALARSYPFVRVVHEPRQGIVYARNAGFSAAHSTIIGRIDADIELPPKWIAHVRDFYTHERNLNAAWSGAGHFYNVRLPRLVSWAYGLLAFRFNKLLLGHYTVWGSNMALTAEQWRAVENAVCLRTDIHEDLDLAIHLAEAGYAITYDTSLKTAAELRRVHTDRHQLLDYLQWWPRTLQVHHRRIWPLCWLVGVGMLYPATFILWFADRLATAFRRR